MYNECGGWRAGAPLPTRTVVVACPPGKGGEPGNQNRIGIREREGDERMCRLLLVLVIVVAGSAVLCQGLEECYELTTNRCAECFAGFLVVDDDDDSSCLKSRGMKHC